MPNQDARSQSSPAIGEREKSSALGANLPREIASDGLNATPLEATVLFGDIVGSTERLAEIGDHRWMGLLREYYAIIRQELVSFQGHHVSTSGDGFLATFDQPVQAIRCASAIRESVKRLGLRLRIGMHFGDCLAAGELMIGLTVHVGARIAATAAPGEVLVSDAVKARIADSDIRFVDRGKHNLRGVPGSWRLFTVS